MIDDDAWLAGELDPWPDLPELARLLKEGGLRVRVGDDSVALPDLEHFVFRGFDGILGDPVIDATAGSADDLVRDATRVSALLAGRDIAHRFEIHAGEDELVAYLHHRWPCVDLSTLAWGDEPPA